MLKYNRLQWSNKNLLGREWKSQMNRNIHIFTFPHICVGWEIWIIIIIYNIILLYKKMKIQRCVEMWKCEFCGAFLFAFFLHFLRKKFAKHNLFIVSLQSRSVIGSHRWRTHKRDVRDGREMVASRFRQRCYMNWDAKHGSIRLTTVANMQPKRKMRKRKW